MHIYLYTIHYALTNLGASKYLTASFLMPPRKKNRAITFACMDWTFGKKEQTHQAMDSPGIEFMAAGQAICSTWQTYGVVVIPLVDCRLDCAHAARADIEISSSQHSQCSKQVLHMSDDFALFIIIIIFQVLSPHVSIIISPSYHLIHIHHQLLHPQEVKRQQHDNPWGSRHHSLKGQT